jgi:hypothetical protein
MTGPEHYLEAERLLREAKRDLRDLRDRPSRIGDPLPKVLGPEQRQQNIALAQVHSTLALAAATALGSSNQWKNAAG